VPVVHDDGHEQQVVRSMLDPMLDQRIAGSYVAGSKRAVVLMMREHSVVVEVPCRSDRAEQVTHHRSSGR
jgi:hypothetical protein